MVEDAHEGVDGDVYAHEAVVAEDMLHADVADRQAGPVLPHNQAEQYIRTTKVKIQLSI